MMSVRAKWEYLRAIHGRDRQAPREGKGQILDEFCATTGYHRKAALRLLHGPPPGRARSRRGRRAATYGAAGAPRRGPLPQPPPPPKARPGGGGGAWFP